MYFSLGVKTRKEDFYNMEAELRCLLEELLNPLTRMIVIKGVRRVGKSSLLRVALSESGLPHLLLDLRAVGPPCSETFYDAFSRNLSALVEKAQSLRSVLSKISGLEVVGFRVELTKREISTISELLKVLDDWSSRRGRPLILAFDEAQDLRFVRGADKLLAHIYDYLQNIKLVLAGSEVGILDRLLGHEAPQSPLFGRAYAEIPIDRLPPRKAKEFLIKGFEQVSVQIEESEVDEAVKLLDGIIGWLTYYGYYRTRESHEKALEKTLEEGSAIVAEELKNILAARQQAKRRYIQILKILERPSRWSEIKRHLNLSLGIRISDKQLTNYIKELKSYGFIVKTDGKYAIADPLTLEAINRHLL
ncbi:MAG: hypothetical protein DRN54_04390 [Thaumarchaeota archaeon]|nr:MAG: hypothetical protein DRN54_04390 [Nitrososphaerota archaeon]